MRRLQAALMALGVASVMVMAMALALRPLVPYLVVLVVLLTLIDRMFPGP